MQLQYPKMQGETRTVLCEHSKRRKRMEQRTRNLISFSVFKQIFNRKTYISFPLGVSTRERQWRRMRAYACGCKKIQKCFNRLNLCKSRSIKSKKKKTKTEINCLLDVVTTKLLYPINFTMLSFLLPIQFPFTNPCAFINRSLLRREH